MVTYLSVKSESLFIKLNNEINVIIFHSNYFSFAMLIMMTIRTMTMTLKDSHKDDDISLYI